MELYLLLPIGITLGHDVQPDKIGNRLGGRRGRKYRDHQERKQRAKKPTKHKIPPIVSGFCYYRRQFFSGLFS